MASLGGGGGGGGGVYKIKPLTGYFPCTLYLEYCFSIHFAFFLNSMRDELDHHSFTMSPFLSNFRPSLMKKQQKVHKLITVRKKKNKMKLSVKANCVTFCFPVA